MKSNKSTSEASVEEFETLFPLVGALHEDIKELTRKNQGAPLSAAKIHMINRLLTRAKAFLKEEPSAAFLDLLDEDLVPQNADAVLVLGQYKAALHQFREQHASYDRIRRRWILPAPGRRTP